MSLVQQLGVAYCNELMAGAHIMHDGAPHQVCGFDEEPGTVTLQRVDIHGRYGERILVPQAVLGTWDAFRFPTLGYREYMDGALLMYLVRRPSVRRGLHLADLRHNLHDASSHLHHILRDSNDSYSKWRGKWGYSPVEYTQGTAGKMWHCFMPTFTPLSKGLPLVLGGERPAFAMSAEFAVGPDPRKDSGLEILYRQRPIGSISDSGKISLNISNKTINELWEEESSRG